VSFTLSPPAAERPERKRAHDRRHRAAHRSLPVKTPRFFTFTAILACGHERVAGYYTPEEKEREIARLSQECCAKCGQEDAATQERNTQTRSWRDRMFPEECDTLPVQRRAA